MTTYFFNIVALLGGLALFLFGMDTMGKALERQAGGKLQTILAKMSSNVFKGFLLGMAVTAVIQSSSATTVMVVGFVNSGIMTLKQAVGVIMGSNIGTTVTAWILSLSGLEGDSFIISGDGRQEVTIAAICENYVAHYIYMSPAYYEKVYGEAAEMNSMLLNLSDRSDESCDKVMTELLTLHGVSSVSRTSDMKNTYLNSMERVDFVVVIVILCAAALAIVVLYNLSNINITERKRELATIKVLGFFDPEVSAYVTRENVVLTALGIAFGCALGKILHNYLVLSVEIDLMMFGRELMPMSYVWAAVLTALFATIVNIMAHRKMRTIDMVESLKSAE